MLALPWSTLRTGLPILANPFRINKASKFSQSGTSTTRSATTSPARNPTGSGKSSAVNSVNRVFFEGVLSLPKEKTGITKVDFRSPTGPRCC